MIGDLFIQHRNNTCAVYMFAGGDFTPIHFPCRNSIRNPNSNAFIDLNNGKYLIKTV